MTPTVVTKRLTAVLAAVVSLTLMALSAPSVVTAAPACPGADGAVESIGKQKAAEAVMCLINAERAASGVGTLTPDANLSLAAQWHSDDMVARNYFSHYSPPPSPHGENWVDRVRNTGFPLGNGEAGENIAANSKTPRESFAVWLGSPGHCYTMLLEDYTHQGVGLARKSNADRDWVWTLEVANLQWNMADSPVPNCPYNRKPSVTPSDPGLPGEKKVLTSTSPGSSSHKSQLKLSNVSRKRHGRVLRLKLRVRGSAAASRSSTKSAKSARPKIRLVIKQKGVKTRKKTLRVNSKGRLNAKIRLAKAKAGSVTVSIVGVKRSAWWLAFA